MRRMRIRRIRGGIQVKRRRKRILLRNIIKAQEAKRRRRRSKLKRLRLKKRRYLSIMHSSSGKHPQLFPNQ